ncbi:MAG: DoxX family protein [Rhodospirillales bacterium]
MIIRLVIRTHDLVFNTLTRFAGDWFLGLAARLVLSSVLLVFFLRSAATKVGDGFPGILVPEIGAYAQIVPSVAESVSYDVSQIAFIPWGLIVHLGTYAEVLLPLMILFGLFTRAASMAMIAFIAVMTFVDIQFHGVSAEAVGAFFDRTHDSPITDQRLLWAFPLAYLMIRGGGRLSLDAVLRQYMRPPSGTS